MRIATWNVNSIRARVDRIVDWMVREDIDVLAMQEIKCKPEQFPAQAVRGRRLRACSPRPQPVERRRLRQPPGPMTDVVTSFPGMPGFLKGEEGPGLPLEARALGVTVNDLRLWSLYVPNGRALDDPHYVYKLDWLARWRSTPATSSPATRTWRSR